MARSAGRLLFSVDVEDFYPADPGLDPRSTPLATLMDGYLELLRRRDVQCTFFIVGDVARRYPEVLQALAAEGHELACHGDHHLTLDQLTPEAFRADLRANRAAIEAASGVRAVGFRAPILSLTEKTSWAYDILADEGFEYSSSVLPAANPLFGWAGFEEASVGVRELPITLARPLGAAALPLFSGTYFRVLPWPVVRPALRAGSDQDPLVCYFHPYDIDHRQPWVMHAGVRGSRPMNALLFLRRKSLLARIARLLDSAAAVERYRDYVARQPTPIGQGSGGG